MLADRFHKSGCPLCKVFILVRRTQVSGLFPASVDQVVCGKVGALDIVDQDAAAVHGWKIRVQEYNRNGKAEAFS